MLMTGNSLSSVTPTNINRSNDVWMSANCTDSDREFYGHTNPRLTDKTVLRKYGQRLNCFLYFG
jgi:hypothetical protein